MRDHWGVWEIVFSNVSTKCVQAKHTWLWYLIQYKLLKVHSKFTVTQIGNQTSSPGSIHEIKTLNYPILLEEHHRRILKRSVTCWSMPSSPPLCRGLDLVATIFISPGLHCYHMEARRWAILLNENAPIDVHYMRDEPMGTILVNGCLHDWAKRCGDVKMRNAGRWQLCLCTWALEYRTQWNMFKIR